MSKRRGLYTSRNPARYLVTPAFLTFVRIYTRLRIEGLNHIPASGPFLLAANHQSHADTAVVFATLSPELRSRVVAAAAAEYFFDKSFRQWISRTLFNVVPVERKPARGADPLRHVRRALREGYGLLIFPEGTRSMNGSLGPFRSGIGRVIAEFPGLPIIPTWIDGTQRVMPKGVLIPRPHQVAVHFGAPITHLRAEVRDRLSWRFAADELREELIRLRDAVIEPPQPAG